MQEQGWIKLFRVLLDKPIWLQSTPEQKTILITLLLMANHKEKEWEWNGEKFKAKPGQFVTSANSIMKKAGLGISRQNVRTALVRFEKYEFLTYKTTKTGMLISIVNWRNYQGNLIEPNQEVTNAQPTTNQEVTTNKNDNNIKNEKKNKFMSDSNEYRLAEYLYKHILRNNPKAKEPNFEMWAKHFDFILRIDERPIEEVKELIKFAQTDSFWFKNILSPDKLRKQYDRLILEMNKNSFNMTKRNSVKRTVKERPLKLLGWDDEINSANISEKYNYGEDPF